MTIKQLLTNLKQQPDTIQFSDVMAVIQAHYTYTAIRFKNAGLVNDAGSNEGSCKLFYFAQLHDLDEASTLALFGDYYRVDVLQNPGSDDHGNIRAFMASGWAGIDFDGVVLQSL